MQSRARNGTGSQPSQQIGAAELGSSSQRCQQMGAAELGSSSQRCVCAVPRQKWHWLTAISTDGSCRTRFELSEMSTDGSCRTRFELSEMCLCSPAGSQPSQQMGAAELGSSSQRCVCAVPRQKWHWLTAISTDWSCRTRFELSEMSTDGSCRTRFELSEMCLCSPAPEMALAHSHLNRWELPN